MQVKSGRAPFVATIALIATLLLSGCGSIISSATGKMADNLARSIQNHDDPATVASAVPAYLLLLDSFIISNPENPEMLLSGAKLYAAYAGIFVSNTERSKRLSQRSLDYALRGVCAHEQKFCSLRQASFTDFSATIKQLEHGSIGPLFTLGQSWAVWLKAHSDDWNAVAELPRIRVIIEHVLQLEDTYQQGSAHLYMGLLESLLPASLGGKPQLAKQHFEKAITLSQRRNLMALVSYAESYARLVFDQPLHDQLLQEVLNANPQQPGLTLSNTLAQQKARQLLDSGKDYF